MGKSRIKGSRPAYEWALPDLGIGGFSLCKCLLHYLQNLHPQDATYLWPALDLKSADLWQLAESTGFLSRRMSRGQFLQCFRGFLCRALVPADEAAKAGYSRLRRCMPTGAHHLGFDEAAAQAIGSWTEVPAGPSSSFKRRGAQPMSRHYAGDKVHSSWQAKQAVLDALLRTFKEGSWPRAEGTSLLKPGSLLWPQVGKLASESRDLETNPKLAALPDEGDSSSEASSCSGASSVDSCVADEDTKVDWFLQGSKRHIIRELDVNSRRVPWCRDSAFHQDPVSRGSGLDRLSRDLWCTRCMNRMPGPQAQHVRLQLE